MAAGLKIVSDLIVQSSMREALYAHRYEIAAKATDHSEFEGAHVDYRKALQEQYTLILQFQAKCVCYYSRNTTSKLASDLVKWDKWDSSIEDIKKQDEAFCKVYSILKDLITEEEYDKLAKRHEDLSKIMDSIAGDTSGLRAAIEKAQSEKRTKELLQWLSHFDSSGGYRNAIEKRKANTGGWLLKDYAGYDNWKEAPNSLLWLHGKGNL